MLSSIVILWGAPAVALVAADPPRWLVALGAWATSGAALQAAATAAVLAGLTVGAWAAACALLAVPEVAALVAAAGLGADALRAAAGAALAIVAATGGLVR